MIHGGWDYTILTLPSVITPNEPKNDLWDGGMGLGVQSSSNSQPHTAIYIREDEYINSQFFKKLNTNSLVLRRRKHWNLHLQPRPTSALDPSTSRWGYKHRAVAPNQSIKESIFVKIKMVYHIPQNHHPNQKKVSSNHQFSGANSFFREGNGWFT